MKNKKAIIDGKEYDEIFTTLQEPYENEHSCRLEDPEKYERFARKNGEEEHDGKPIDVLYGIKANGKSEIQALRYPKSKWSASEAKKHCQSRGGKFEAASSSEEKSEDPDALTESLKQLHEIKESHSCTIEVIEEAKGRPVKIRGCFIDADLFNDSEPRRLYPESTLRKAVEAFNEKDTKLGLDGHKFDGAYADVVLLHDRLWLDQGKGWFESTIISETDGGKVIQFIAEKKLPITVSLFGLGSEMYDKDVIDKKGRVGGYIVQEGYKIERLDAVLSPAFSNAKAMIKESQEKQTKEATVDEKLLTQIKELTEKVQGFEKQIADLNKNAEANKDVIAELKTERDKAVNLVEAKKKVKEILESRAEELKSFSFMAQLKEHLELCESPAEVEKNFPRILKTLQGFKGEAKEEVKPSGVVILEEKGFFGDKSNFLGGHAPSTIEEAYRWMLDKFEDKGPFVHPLDNPRHIGEVLLKNQIKLIMAGGSMQSLDIGIPDSDIFRNTRKNPLYMFTKKGLMEALGDTEAYTGDIQSTGAYILPLYTWVVKDQIDLMQGVIAIQPMDRPEGKAFFMKEFYGSGAAWTGVIGNFDRTKGNKAEAEAPQLMKVQIDTAPIALGSAKKLIAVFTIELEQDMVAHFGLNCEASHVQLLRNEINREISADMLYNLLEAAASVKGDGLIVKATDNFSLSPDTGFTGGEWITKGFTRAIKQSGAKMDVDPFNVVPDWTIADSQLAYLFTESQFVADDSAKKPTTFGFRKQGTFQNEYASYFTSHASYANTVLLGFRGSSFADAPMSFHPYVMFYLGPRIDTTDLKASRTCMHRSAYFKSCGGKLVRINIVP
jgi:hypothetical protein